MATTYDSTTAKRVAIAQAAYANAQKAGDTKAMAQAHSMAETARSEGGYTSGGVDGSSSVKRTTTTGTPVASTTPTASRTTTTTAPVNATSTPSTAVPRTTVNINTSNGMKSGYIEDGKTYYDDGTRMQDGDSVVIGGKAYKMAGGQSYEIPTSQYLNEQSSAYDKQKAESMANQAYDNANTQLEQAYNQSIFDQQQQRKDVESAYRDQNDQLNQDTFDSIDLQKASMAARGFGDSRQIEDAVASGMSRATVQRQKNLQARNDKLQTISDRIAMLTQNKDLGLANAQRAKANAITSAEYGYASDVAKYGAQAQMQQEQNAFTHNENLATDERRQGYTEKNMSTQNTYDLNKMSINQGYNEKNMATQEGYTKDNMAIQQGYTQTNMATQQKYTQANMATQNAYDKEKMAIQQDYAQTNMNKAAAIQEHYARFSAELQYQMEQKGYDRDIGRKLNEFTIGTQEYNLKQKALDDQLASITDGKLKAIAVQNAKNQDEIARNTAIAQAGYNTAVELAYTSPDPVEGNFMQGIMSIGREEAVAVMKLFGAQNPKLDAYTKAYLQYKSGQISKNDYTAIVPVDAQQAINNAMFAAHKADPNASEAQLLELAKKQIKSTIPTGYAGW